MWVGETAPSLVSTLFVVKKERVEERFGQGSFISDFIGGGVDFDTGCLLCFFFSFLCCVKISLSLFSHSLFLFCRQRPSRFPLSASGTKITVCTLNVG